jgi:hypothetical protein
MGESYSSKVSMPTKLSFAGRLWFYFRMGYNTYITFILGYLTTIVTVYYLAIKSIPPLLDLFPSLTRFAILVALVGSALSIWVGWVHMKRSPMYSSEVDVAVEANPYNYRLPPGFNREVFGPLYLELLNELKMLLASQNLLDVERKKRIEALEHKLQILIDGGTVGKPSMEV